MTGVLLLGGYVYYKKQSALAAIDKERQKENTKKSFFADAQATSDSTLLNSFFPQISERLKELTDIKNTLSLLRQPDTDKEQKAELWKKMQVQGCYACWLV